MKIPRHLEQLRRDRRGLPVPFVNRWGPERVESLRIEYDPWTRHQGVFVVDEDQDEPDFTAQNMGRQREAMFRGLCQVCARAVPWGARYLVVAAMSVERINLGGRECWSITEPWLCGLCARFALRTCPALIRRRRDEQLHLICPDQRDVTLTVSQGVVDGPLHDLSRAVMPVMTAKAVVPTVERLVVIA